MLRPRLLLAVLLLGGCSGGGHQRSEVIHNATAREVRSKPDFDAMQEALQTFAEAVPLLADGLDKKAALSVLGSPLWIDGIRYSGVRDKELQAKCSMLAGLLTTRAALERFTECAVIGDWRYSDPTGVTEVTVDTVPAVYAKHRAQLAALAPDHRFAFAHFCPAAPGDYWTLFAATRDARGNVVIDAILVFNEEEADCRDEVRTGR